MSARQVFGKHQKIMISWVHCSTGALVVKSLKHKKESQGEKSAILLFCHNLSRIHIYRANFNQNLIQQFSWATSLCHSAASIDHSLKEINIKLKGVTKMKWVQKEKQLIAMNITQIDISNYRKVIGGVKDIKGIISRRRNFADQTELLTTKRTWM